MNILHTILISFAFLILYVVSFVVVNTPWEETPKPFAMICFVIISFILAYSITGDI